jgi:hypothetical protein
MLERLFLAAGEGMSDDYESGIPLVAAARVGNALRLTFEDRGSGASIQVMCRGHLSHHVRIGWTSPDLVNDHPLLWARAEPEVEVYFHGAPPDPEQVERDLQRAHASATDDWIEYRRNADAPLAGGYGLLATAPARVAAAYVQVLADAGVNSATIARHVQVGRHFDDDPWEVVSGVPQLLMLDSGSRSYVVATDFEETTGGSLA